MSGGSSTVPVPSPALTPAQILARLESLSAAQVAQAAATVPALTGPTGVRMLLAANPATIGLLLPSTPRRSPFDY